MGQTEGGTEIVLAEAETKSDRDYRDPFKRTNLTVAH
jgi:hypothetical protein